MRLLLIRHGESQGNAGRVISGRVDFPLSERGHAQAAATAERLREAGLAAVYTSPLERARQTADPLAGATGLEAAALEDVQEYDYGELSGASVEHFRELLRAGEPVQRYMQGDFPPFPGEEGRERFRERVCRAMWSVVEGHRGETAAVVCHGGPIVVFVLEALGLPYRRPIPLTVRNCSITTIDIRDDEPASLDTPVLAPAWARPRAVLTSFNDACHVDGV